MEKPASNAHPIHDLLRRRWSPRVFMDKPVSSKILRSLFEAARWAPSSYNDQPWVYFLATREEIEDFARLLSVLTDQNFVWARKAPVLALSVARMNFNHNGKPNRVALHDVGAASAQLTLEATSRGLGVRQIAGFSVERAQILFEIPDGWEPVALIAIGYPGEPDILLPEIHEVKQARRMRKPLSQFVMSSRWGRPSAIISESAGEYLDGSTEAPDHQSLASGTTCDDA
jgi:nitroreductase